MGTGPCVLSGERDRPRGKWSGRKLVRLGCRRSTGILACKSRQWGGGGGEGG